MARNNGPACPPVRNDGIVAPRRSRGRVRDHSPQAWLRNRAEAPLPSTHHRWLEHRDPYSRALRVKPHAHALRERQHGGRVAAVEVGRDREGRLAPEFAADRKPEQMLNGDFRKSGSLVGGVGASVRFLG